MAESLVQVTEGAGKKLHTFSRVIGANTVEDEVVIPGEPYLPEYRAIGNNTFPSLATADSHVVQVMAGATLNLYIRRIRIYQFGMATAAAIGRFELVRLTTAGTGGTAFTFAPMDSTAAAAGASLMTLPTVKGTEGASLDMAAVNVEQTLGASQNPGSILLIDWDYRSPRVQSPRIPAGLANGIAVKNRAGFAAATYMYAVDLVEANF